MPKKGLLDFNLTRYKLSNYNKLFFKLIKIVFVVYSSICITIIYAKENIRNHQNHNLPASKPNKEFTAKLTQNSNKSLPKTKNKKEVEIKLRSRIRLEDWDTFNRINSNQDSSYQNLLSLTELQLKSTGKKSYDYEARINFAKFLQLPENASFGTGSAYYRGGFRKTNFKPYLRQLYFSFYNSDRSWRFDVGRFDYNDIIEFKSKNKDLEWIKEFRISGRMIAIPGFQILQRSMNGININYNQKKYNLNLSAWKPTTGTTHKQAGDIMNDVKVFTLSNTFKFEKTLKNHEFQVFAYKYKDNRDIVVNRPDNSQPTVRTTNGIDININSYGFWAVGLHDVNAGKGRIDNTIWYIFQTGDWFEQDHKAYAYLIELGYKFKHCKSTPWIRTGLFKSSGDSDPTDNKHETYYPYLPFNRKHSKSLTFGLQNLEDRFLQLITQPHKDLRLELEYHRIKLSEGNDKWYNGGGPIANTGNSFGVSINNTNGSTDFGTSIDFAVNYKINRESQLIFSYSKFYGGSVIKNNFNSKNDQDFAYIEYVHEFTL